MGKRTKPGIMQVQQTVEKSPRRLRDRCDLPSWYHRVFSFSYEDGDVAPKDFDEDLSDLEEEEEEKEEDCECSDQDCDCQIDDDDSERSYDGSDADYYYELKELREERKLQKLKLRKEMERERAVHRTKEEEVRAAYRSLKTVEGEQNTTSLESLEGEEFMLFCSDHVTHFHRGVYTAPRVRFYSLDDDGVPGSQKQPGGENDMCGDVYLDANANCNFGPFCPPNVASRKSFKVKSCNGEYKLSFKFIGNGYLKLRVPRQFAFMDEYSSHRPAPAPTAPKVFKFVGIRRDLEKEEAERQEMMAHARRPPSPGETWFEMNHPMGSWKSGCFW